MRSLSLLSAASAALHFTIARAQADSSNGLVVTTGTGTYTGIINGTAPNVRQFLNIPYSVPPISDRRWLPPTKVTTNSSSKFDATQYPPSCPQYVSKVSSVYNQDFIQYQIVDGAESFTAGFFAGATSEDCLSLAIWTPVQNAENLPVAVFMTGGGFYTGGINIPYQLPYHWVQRTGAHIVVTINYRVNIGGFPNAAGLTSQNLGLLDQRLALEWVRDNIAPFGGDPSKITLWGQSAGASSVDYQNFAFPTDPIVHGFFMQSGTVFLPLASKDAKKSNFTFVASHVGCGGLKASDELACMRKVPMSKIENFVGQYQDNSTLVNPSQPPIMFTPIPDGKIVFANYTDRYVKGAFARIPAIVSNTANEGVALIPYPKDPTHGPNQKLANEVTLSGFICPSANTSMYRLQNKVPTYRYQFAGNFSNISPRPWMGPYHASDLPMMFATHQDYRGASTQFEFEVSQAMEDHLLAFMKDPVNGPSSIGWKSYAKGGMLRFGAGGKVVQNVSVNTVDGACFGIGTYNPTPGDAVRSYIVAT